MGYRPILSLIAVLAIISASAQAQTPPREVLMGAYQHALDTIDAYPPDQYFVLNWGVNTDLMDLFASEIIGDSQKTSQYMDYLPVFRIGHVDPEIRIEILRKIIPSKLELRGRQLVFNRVLHAGYTAAAVSAQLAQVLTEKGHTQATMSYVWLGGTGTEKKRLREYHSLTDFDFQVDFISPDERWKPYLKFARDTYSRKEHYGRKKLVDAKDFTHGFPDNTSPILEEVQSTLKRTEIPAGFAADLADAFAKLMRSSPSFCIRSALDANKGSQH